MHFTFLALYLKIFCWFLEFEILSRTPSFYGVNFKQCMCWLCFLNSVSESLWTLSLSVIISGHIQNSFEKENTLERIYWPSPNHIGCYTFGNNAPFRCVAVCAPETAAYLCKSKPDCLSEWRKTWNWFATLYRTLWICFYCYQVYVISVIWNYWWNNSTYFRKNEDHAILW